MRDIRRDLDAAAALTSGWPTVHVTGADEAEVLAAQARLEAVLGPLPQADVIEPWGDADEAGWELRVDVPDAGEAAWHAIAGDERAALRPGVPPGARAARDHGLVVGTPFAADGFVATEWIEAETGRVLTPDALPAGAVDAGVADLARDVVDALRDAHPALRLESDRGPDVVEPIVHRATGRLGVRFLVPPDAIEAVGDSMLARDRALAAMAAIVRARADHDVRVAPDGWADTRLGLGLGLWLIAPPVGPLPPPPPATDGDSDLLYGLCEDVEIHIVPDATASHAAVAAAVAAWAERHATGWVGGLPRWLPTTDGPRFTPTWRARPGDPALARLDGVRDLAGVVAVRVVPGEPVGLGDAWAVSDADWWPVSRAWVQRVRDGVTDRDRLPRTDDRRPDPRDGWAVGLPARPIADRAGRGGVEIGLDARRLLGEGLAAAASAVLDRRPAEAAGVVGFAWRASGPVLQVWYAGPTDGRRWG